jgi:hypothetical protein
MLDRLRSPLAMLVTAGALVVGAYVLPGRVMPAGHADAAGTPAGVADMAWVTSPAFRSSLGTLKPTAAPSGAFGINAQWESGASKVWYVSQQEAGADAIAYGVANGDRNAIDLGLREFEWAFAHQQPDGSFEPQYDIVASQVITATLFDAAAARGLLLLRASTYGPDYAARIDAMVGPLQRSVNWFTADARWTPWVKHVDNGTGYGVFTHQDYAAAAAIGLTSALSGDTSQMPKALERIDVALSHQAPAGWNMEIDGPDTGYGALGVSYALHFAQWLPDSPATPKLLGMVGRAIAWERTRVASDGWIDHTRNTRSCNAREGMKDPGYSTMADQFGSWGEQTDDAALISAGAAALQFARSAPDRRCEDRPTAAAPDMTPPVAKAATTAVAPAAVATAKTAAKRPTKATAKARTKADARR